MIKIDTKAHPSKKTTKEGVYEHRSLAKFHHQTANPPLNQAAASPYPKSSRTPSLRNKSSILQPNIASLALLPLLPRNLICLLEIPHPSRRIEQRTRPARLIQHASQLTESAHRAMALVNAISAKPYSLVLVVLVIRRNQILSSLRRLRRLGQRAFENRRRHARAHFVLVARQCE
jgi:hypothetical protein